jgi:hypothetical protein
MNLPSDMIEINSFTTIYFNTTGSLVPTLPLGGIVCEWMKVSEYGRQWETSKLSLCTYDQVAFTITVLAPLWHLTALDGSSQQIPYVLRIRQFDIMTSVFTDPITSQIE